MAVKTYQIDPRFPPEVRDLLQRVGPVVERVLGTAGARVDVAWEPGPSHSRAGEPAARLRLTDSGVSRTREFEALDLEDEVRLRRQVYLMWDQLLAERLRRQREAVLQSLSGDQEA